ncbi:MULTISPECIES: energy-coupling factor ABC transporter ATP-binding protein [Geobacillus]|jgi:energy-coupling factor transport system ATP-binding protein|uniref:energy-coupling factor ABC transporter ATP-binding protein n=1 Tax=Geobacillus TaxID=129337 RepID=UPI00017E6780|nr:MULTISPECIES: energy-coupling factor ABC transporter ATP-binding protein [Geobacillus]ARA98030.1 energy-coupling factor ABC transporter ATP-binding protein [Geobacillus thermodenitrificans]ATO37388.1 energy-coupling factor ABC transporter ATP-binding protein [Geobacillus thermodenitrificans]MEC5189543.1 energy-coupling factor transport system ATP-binding protein [Geobacillus thermodenitrificans]MED0664569.1 energy-coupling factor transporter ATPase [Geobacillus thermodenitrificans]OQP09692.
MDIVFEKVEHVYNARSPFARRALYDVNVTIADGTYVAIVGHTGSGKSTLLQHLNGLLQPTSGTVKIGEETITGSKRPKQLKPLRKKVGIVFQFPEHQLFEETVEKDICFGPLNFGVPEEEAKRKAKELVKLVGLNEDVLAKSPFDLSGGQMRRVAIAGVLALEPEMIVLDEPTAGLDPRGRKEIMEMFYRLHHEKQLTTVLVTHSMEDAAQYADEIIVMHEGTVWGQGTPEEIFRDPERLAAIGLSVPETVKLKQELERRFGVTIPSPCLTIEQTADAIKQLFSKVSVHDQ